MSLTNFGSKEEVKGDEYGRYRTSKIKPNHL
jgi:hypothetical protein